MESVLDHKLTTHTYLFSSGPCMCMNILVPQNPSCWEIDLPVEGVCTAGDYSITQMATNEMLHKVPGVQFSFSDDNTILSESIERAVNVIADSVDSAFLMIIIWGNPRIQAATVIWVESDATSWVKTHGRYQRTSPHWKSLLKKDDSEAWRTTKVASIHQLENQYTTKQVEHNLPSWCSGIVSWVDLYCHKISFVGLLLILRLPF